ncbi:MAG TPA: class I SAM-dependent methyltransferase [Candidatus Binataceae bacterium]|nr:class I SAM-dependent methyltransferase [Candidatus Binataceae bacterium]
MADDYGAPGSAQSTISMMQGAATTAALKAGIDLEVFTHIAHGDDTPEKIAAAKKLPVRSTRILCDALVAFGALLKSDGRYTNSPGAQALFVKGSPAYAGGMTAITANPLIWNELARLTEVVRTGHTLLENRSAEAEDNPFWQDFARGSRMMAQLAGPAVAETAASMFPGGAPKKILDIACGSGFYGFGALKRFPGARLTSVDWPGVLKHAQANAQQAGVADRAEFRAGDIFADDLGSGYDLILAPNIYHHFSLEKNLELSRRLYAAAAPGGALVIVDMVPDEAREKDRFALAFALTMLIWTRDGDTYTLSEYRKMLEPAGFREVKLATVPGPAQYQAVLARK